MNLVNVDSNTSIEFTVLATCKQDNSTTISTCAMLARIITLDAFSSFVGYLNKLKSAIGLIILIINVIYSENN